MAVEEAEIDEIRRVAANARDSDELLPLQTIPEVIGYVVLVARQEGRDECDDVERVLRASDDTDIIRAEFDALVKGNAPEWRVASCRRRLDWAIDYRKRILRETERVLRALGYLAVADRLKAMKFPRRKRTKPRVAS